MIPHVSFPDVGRSLVHGLRRTPVASFIIQLTGLTVFDPGVALCPTSAFGCLCLDTRNPKRMSFISFNLVGYSSI